MTASKHYALPLVEAEDSLAAIFPNELLEALQLGVGDVLHLAEQTDGSLILKMGKGQSGVSIRKSTE
ncbi:MAG: hypothetical protein EON54_28185 [Alcaligenaceae bacterium]|nr:MAG: hypothetical protein EON54_28185 [Alcaligenaceae bacterium]